MSTLITLLFILAIIGIAWRYASMRNAADVVLKKPKRLHTFITARSIEWARDPESMREMQQMPARIEEERRRMDEAHQRIQAEYERLQTERPQHPTPRDPRQPTLIALLS